MKNRAVLDMIKAQYDSTDEDTFVTFLHSVGNTETFMVTVNHETFTLDITKRPTVEILNGAYA